MLWSQPPEQDVADHPCVVPLFVYGTLRPGGESHGRVAGLLAGPPHPAAVAGRLVACSAGDWPLLVPGTATVHGDVLPVRAGPDLFAVLGGWELAWGYSLRWVPVLDDGRRVIACVWEWPDLVGDEVPSGDWLARTTPGSSGGEGVGSGGKW